MTKTPSYQPVEVSSEHVPRQPKAGFIAALNRGWILEILGASIGTALIVALAIILRIYDGKSPPELGHAFGTAITLNTIVSLLSTVAKATLLFTVAECIGQQKWMYFMRRSRQLSRMSSFDQASRGIWGGLTLIWETKAMNIATIGAFLMVYAIAVDPLSQQLVVTTSVWITVGPDSGPPYENTNARICHTWNDSNAIINNWNAMGNVAWSSMTSLGIKGAIENGLFTPTGSVEDISPSCFTGYCDWESYTSLAVCASFANVTSSLRHVMDQPPPEEGEPEDLLYVSANQLIMLYGDYDEVGLINITSATSPNQWNQPNDPYLDFNNSIAFNNYSDSTIADFFAIYYTGNLTNMNGSQGYEATEILLEWCVQDFTTSVSAGTSVTKRLKDSYSLEIIRDPPVTPLDGLEYSFPTGSNISTPIFRVDSFTHNSMLQYLQSFANGSATVDHYGQISASSAFAQAIYEPFIDWQGRIPLSGEGSGPQPIVGSRFLGLQTRINNMATAMTNYMRSSSNTNLTTLIPGTPSLNVPVIRVEWPWITVLVLFAGTTWVFLFATIIAQRWNAINRNTAWKTSSLAVMHALGPRLQRQLRGIEEHALMFSQDEQVRVRLKFVRGEGWRLETDDEHMVRGKQSVELKDQGSAEHNGALPDSSENDNAPKSTHLDPGVKDLRVRVGEESASGANSIVSWTSDIEEALGHVRHA